MYWKTLVPYSKNPILVLSKLRKCLRFRPIQFERLVEGACELERKCASIRITTFCQQSTCGVSRSANREDNVIGGLKTYDLSRTPRAQLDAGVLTLRNQGGARFLVVFQYFNRVAMSMRWADGVETQPPVPVGSRPSATKFVRAVQNPNSNVWSPTNGNAADYFGVLMVYNEAQEPVYGELIDGRCTLNAALTKDAVLVECDQSKPSKPYSAEDHKLYAYTVP